MIYLKPRHNLRVSKSKKSTQAPVAHACNPSYSGSRDPKDHGSKPVWAKYFTKLYLKKKTSQERAGGMAQGVGPEFKPQYPPKKRVRNLK
jgi:hypothetical protein